MSQTSTLQTQILHVTDNAKQKVLEFMQAEEKEGWSLRLEAVPSGPRRFQYALNLEPVDDVKDDDHTIDCGDFRLLLDPESARWIAGSTMDFVNRGLESGFRFDNPQAKWTDPVAQAVQDVLDEKINPMVASHGGRVELVKVDEGAAVLSFGGGCQGCGMADVTLKQGVEVAILEAVPAITAVRDVTDHAAGENPYYAAAAGDSPF